MMSCSGITEIEDDKYLAVYCKCGNRMSVTINTETRERTAVCGNPDCQNKIKLVPETE